MPVPSAPVVDPPQPGLLKRTVPLAFPLILCLVSNYFLLGRTGHWTDDYLYNLREPETGRITTLWLDRPVHFFRPLYRLIVPPLLTLLWDQDWVIHAISALAHMCCAWTLYTLLLGLGVGRSAAAIGSLLFVVHPSHFEAVQWASALPTVLATGVCLWALAWLTRHREARWTRQAGVVFAASLAALCLNEQPAVLMAAAPFVVLRASDASRRWEHAVGAIIAGIAAGVVYTALHFLWRGMTALSGAGEPALVSGPASQLRNLFDCMLSRWFLTGSYARAWPLAISTLEAHPFRTAGAASAGVAALIPWVLWNRRCGGIVQADSQRANQWTAPAALIVMAVAPIVIISVLNPGSGPTWRSCYSHMAGLAGLIAWAVHALGTHGEAQSIAAARRRTLLALAAAALFAAMAILGVGFQAGFNDRDARDQQELGRLHRAIPIPEPGSIFVAARVGLPSPPTPRTRDWDGFFRGPFVSWTPEYPVRLEFKRSDLRAFCPNQWYQAFIVDADERGLTTALAQHVSWDKAIPFVVTADSQIELVSKVILRRAGQPDRTFTVPQTERVRLAAGLGARTFLIAQKGKAPP
jgi:hypothetical protein